ncbi:MAG: hypothetical protein WCP89_04210, partial [archaeon]
MLKKRGVALFIFGVGFIFFIFVLASYVSAVTSTNFLYELCHNIDRDSNCIDSTSSFDLRDISDTNLI